jgi:DNA helicase II / ATP-dependent DNA helicase PcrA
MPQVIDVSEEDIAYAEKILLPIGKVFDEERRAFIRNLNTIDLQAVPGSGKTTVLLAKLLILERKLPFADGSGVLVISHTNAAIDEIKEKIHKDCPKLFSYPNYVGTIQGFVDNYLAIPLYNNIFKSKLCWIDKETYQNELVRLFKIIAWNDDYDKPTTWFYRRHIAKATAECNGNDDLKKQLCNKYIENEVRDLYFDFIESSVKNKKQVVLLKDPNNNKFIGLKKIIFEVLSKGVISYDYAYHFGELYLHALPAIREILQKRFSFVFVDEMQDMDMHQYNLLEKIFFDEGRSVSKFQRIGDKNQAIFNSVETDEVWTDRAEVLKLSGSQRLSKPIADVVKKFAIHADPSFDIVGLNVSNVKPHILVFDDQTIKNIIPSFIAILKENSFWSLNKSVKVICWNTDWKDDEVSRQDPEKLRLENYFEGYRKEQSISRIDYDCLKSYLLNYAKEKRTLKPVRQNILNALLKLLRLEKINDSSNRPYTLNKLLDFVRDCDAQKYEELNLNLYSWSIELIKGNVDTVWEQIKAYTHDFLFIFSKSITTVGLDFINNSSSPLSASIGQSVCSNVYSDGEVNFEVTSVHAVKGQTHSATLYLESYFNKDGSGEKAKSYESERLASQFLGEELKNNAGDRVKQSAKMVYVGLSRPTDLLCVAIHKDRFDKYLSAINPIYWVIKIVS